MNGFNNISARNRIRRERRRDRVQIAALMMLFLNAALLAAALVVLVGSPR